MIRELKTAPQTGQKVQDRVHAYTLDGEAIHGVRWSGTNFYSLKEIIGYSNEGMINGRIHVFGRPIEVGDFVYTNVPPDQWIPNPTRGPWGGNLQENDVYIIVNGDYAIVFEEP